MRALPFTDALLDLIPPIEGVDQDHSGAPPRDWVPNRLFAWARPNATQAPEIDNRAEMVLRARIVLTVDSEGEEHAEQPERSVSERLDTGIETIVGALTANRVHELWHQLQIEELHYNAVRTFEVRAHAVDVLVRFDSPLALDPDDEETF
jgi:hypothetical protein